MADSSLGYTPGTGATVDTRTNSAGEHRQVMTVGNDGDHVAGVEAWGHLQVTQGPATLFYDDFSAVSLNTTDLWSSSATVPTLTAGRMVMPSTTGYHSIRSLDLMPNGVGFHDVRMGVQLEAATVTGVGRFWGLGVPATTPSPTSLVQHGAGFEIDQATGALLAVTYNDGNRVTVATLTRPTDNELHRYAVVHRVTGTYWIIDTYAKPVAAATFTNVVNADLAVLFVRQNAASITGTPTFSSTAVFCADTHRDGTMISDSMVPARRARVDMGGRLWTRQGPAMTSTITSVTAAAASTTLLAANANRLGATIYNDSTARLYLGLTASAVSLTSYTVQIPAGGYYELPIMGGLWTGGITGIWSAANGAARVTELVA